MTDNVYIFAQNQFSNLKKYNVQCLLNCFILHLSLQNTTLKKRLKKKNSSNCLHTLLVEKFASTAASQLLICNSGSLVILGIFTELPCTPSSSLCSSAKGKHKPWYSEQIKSSPSSQVSLLKTKPPHLL